MVGTSWLLDDQYRDHLVSSSSAVFSVLAWGSHLPSGHCGHALVHLTMQIPSCKSALLCASARRLAECAGHWVSTPLSPPEIP